MASGRSSSETFPATAACSGGTPACPRSGPCRPSRLRRVRPRQRARLKRLAFLLTGDLDTAEDLLQSAYAKILLRWRHIGRHDHPDAYMRRVMVTIRISWWRRIRGREITTGEVPDAVRRSGEDGDPAVGEVDLDLALRALRALPRRQQVAVVLRHYCDLSEAETASLMGITVGGVKSQTSKGLAALRVALPPSAVNEEPIR